MRKTEGTGMGLNGLSLGVHKVFDAEDSDYLKKRFEHWNIKGPPGYEPHIHELPPVFPADALPPPRKKVAHLQEKTLHGFRACSSRVLDHYFPLIGDETVVEDKLTFMAERYFLHPAGTAVVIRRTTKAELFYIDPNVVVELRNGEIAGVDKRSDSSAQRLTLSNAVDEAKIATEILGQFASLIPGPEGKAAAFGIEMLSTVLGMAGESGPSWDDIKKMMREVVRDELITNDLEHIQASYSTVKKWSDVQYLPNRGKKSQEDLWAMLRPQIDLVARHIDVLLQPNHRVAGFGLLLLGVDLYLCLLQEQLSLGYDADIRGAASRWATDMLRVWDEVKRDRNAQIHVDKFSYGVPEPSKTVITCYYWNWKDNKTNESKGCRSGPWCESKHGDAGAECRADAKAQFDNVVLPNMVSTFGAPDATAEAWKKIMVPAALHEDPRLRDKSKS